MTLPLLQQQLRQDVQTSPGGLVLPTPRIIYKTDVAIGGRYASRPLGGILHSSRSGDPTNTVHEEWEGTANYAEEGAKALGLSWTWTVGDGKLAIHLEPGSWGHNAGEHSDEYLAAEFAQALLGQPITDGQILTFCWAWVNLAEPQWPGIPRVFPNHADLPQGIRAGKTDVEPRGQHTVRDRILAVLAAVG